jgi:transposase
LKVKTFTPGNRPVSSWTFVMEFFGWRRFRNRREVAALAGLIPTQYDSGSRLPRTRDQ